MRKLIMSLLTTKHVDVLNKFLKKLSEGILMFRNTLWKYTARDYQCILILIALAVLLRFPFIAQPHVTQFDEVIYVNYTLHTLFGEPFFDIHPPLARMLFAYITQTYMPVHMHIHSIEMTFGEEFDDFPYVALRYALAGMGVLLILVAYLIGRVIGYRPRGALLPALLIVFDSALVVYSRSILPDTILLVCNFLAVLLTFLAIRSKNKKLFYCFTLFAGIAIGLAISIKWTALGVLLLLWLIFIMYRRSLGIIVTGVTLVIVYTAVFVLYFYIFFPHGGVVTNPAGSLNQPWIQSIEFPKNHSLSEIVRFLPAYHLSMLRAEQDPNVLALTLPGVNPLSWPLAKSSIIFWIKGNGILTPNIISIVCGGNPASWTLSFFVLLFDIGWIFAVYRKTRKLAVDKDELILIAGFVMNYLPFFFIHRPMYLYHYFTALIFLFLLIPKVAPRIIKCLALLTKDKMFASVFVYFSLFLVLLNFILMMPSTYGF